eukprot:Anaeramoba_ignava/c19781_g1_i3.p1 GENE.c19781_g1_i3~~c19781_g1_i3.p1  ORF type:complete len:267 (-),score=68.64 c19781_g1_i3:1408-2208(-)
MQKTIQKTQKIQMTDIYDVQDENKLPQWIRTQMKTFTRWCNTYLKKRSLSINNIRRDFSDGVRLLHLVELLSGKNCRQKIAQKPSLKIQKISNCNIALNFIEEVKPKNSMELVNIGSQDLVDQNLKITLGLIWILIRRYHISSENDEKTKSIQDILLDWLRNKLESTGIRIDSLTTSLKDGIALCELINKLKPGTINISELDKSQPEKILELAFQKANEVLNIPQLLDPADMLIEPDKLSVITYLSYFKNYEQLNVCYICSFISFF